MKVREGRGQHLGSVTDEVTKETSLRWGPKGRWVLGKEAELIMVHGEREGLVGGDPGDKG